MRPLPVEILRMIMAYLSPTRDRVTLHSVVHVSSQMYAVGAEVLYSELSVGGARCPPLWVPRAGALYPTHPTPLEHLEQAYRGWPRDSSDSDDEAMMTSLASIGAMKAAVASTPYPEGIWDPHASTAWVKQVMRATVPPPPVLPRPYPRRAGDGPAGARALDLAIPHEMLRYLEVRDHDAAFCAGRKITAPLRVLRVHLRRPCAPMFRRDPLLHETDMAPCCLLTPAPVLVVRGATPETLGTLHIAHLFPPATLDAARHVVIFLSVRGRAHSSGLDTTPMKVLSLLRLAYCARRLSLVFDAPPNTNWAGGGPLTSTLFSERRGPLWFIVLLQGLVSGIVARVRHPEPLPLDVELVNTRSLGFNLELGGITDAWVRDRAEALFELNPTPVQPPPTDDELQRLSVRSMKEFISAQSMRGILDDEEVNMWMRSV